MNKNNLQKKIFLRTFGCQMNEHDSLHIIEAFAEVGYDAVDQPEAADVILFNTCSVRQHAEERVWGQVLALKKLKQVRPEVVLGIIGCMAQAYKDSIFDRLPHVDLVCGTDRIADLPRLVEEVQQDHRRVSACEEDSSFTNVTIASSKAVGLKRFVAIMRGCNNFCSYCIVPYVRGRERSRKPDEIIREVEELVKNGCREITLLGQNVNSYGENIIAGSEQTEEPVSFAELLRRLDALDGEYWIRFLTSHPKDISDALISVMASGMHVCEHMHLPIQSGSDRILHAMNRGYTTAQYCMSVAKLCSYMPQVSITTDIIVGYPGETDDDFHATYDLMMRVRFDDAFIFKYSPRAGTKAAEIDDNVPQAVKEARLAALLTLQRTIALEKNKALIGQTHSVLVNGESKQGNGQLVGRSRTHKKVVFDGDTRLIGRFVDVTINDAQDFTLIGSLV